MTAEEKPYRTWVVEFRLRWLVEAQGPDAARQWADWTLSGLRAAMPHTDPHPLGVIVLGPAGGLHAQVIDVLPVDATMEERTE